MKKINNKTLYALKSSSRKVMEDAFNMIYQEYVYLIFYVSLKIVKNNVVAEDITNETFMQFYLNKDRLNENKNLKYYLVYIAKNLSLNCIDKQQKETILAETIDIQSTSTNDFKSYLQKFKNFLNEEELELLIYHYLYNFTFKEIAKEKNVTVNSISSKFKRTLDKIKKHYKGESFYE